MTLSVDILKRRSYFKQVFVENITLVQQEQKMGGEQFSEPVMEIHARPFKRLQCLCPVCMKKCPPNGHKYTEPSRWRDLNDGVTPVYILYRPHTIICPEHGERNEYIPWQDGDSRFTPDFNNSIAWLSTRMTKSDIALLMGINWRTVGNCVSTAWKRIEPDPSQRVHGVTRLCVDEVSYTVGYHYITVVYDMDKEEVVWIREGHSKEVFSKFCEEMTEEERLNVKIVAGDGAKWIDACVREYFPNATRCMDPFHVTQWAVSALDEVRKAESRSATINYKKLNRAYEKQQRSADDNTENQITEEELEQAKNAAAACKGAKYALAHNPENRTDTQDKRIKLIELSSKTLYKAFELKEKLRVILHMTDVDAARVDIEKWEEEARTSGIQQMVELAQKIENRKEEILNSIRHHANSAKSEATNTLIKGLIRMARGFRVLKNLIALVFLKCSNLVSEQKGKRRQYMKEYRRRKEDLRKCSETECDRKSASEDTCNT